MPVGAFALGFASRHARVSTVLTVAGMTCAILTLVVESLFRANIKPSSKVGGVHCGADGIPLVLGRTKVSGVKVSTPVEIGCSRSRKLNTLKSGDKNASTCQQETQSPFQIQRKRQIRAGDLQASAEVHSWCNSLPWKSFTPAALVVAAGVGAPLGATAV
jgi:hypothetical protein